MGARKAMKNSENATRFEWNIKSRRSIEDFGCITYFVFFLNFF